MTGGCQLRMSQRNPIALGPRAARNLLLASVLAVAGTSARSSTAADTSSERRVDRLAFGSCNKQWKPQPAWGEWSLGHSRKCHACDRPCSRICALF